MFYKEAVVCQKISQIKRLPFPDTVYTVVCMANYHKISENVLVQGEVL